MHRKSMQFTHNHGCAVKQGSPYNTDTYLLVHSFDVHGLQVVDQRNSDDYAMKQSEFFKAFRAGGDLVKGSSERLMLKVKDYPPDAAFAEQMPRHWQVSFACSFLFCSTPADARCKRTL